MMKVLKFQYVRKKQNKVRTPKMAITTSPVYLLYPFTVNYSFRFLRVGKL